MGTDTTKLERDDRIADLYREEHQAMVSLARLLVGSLALAEEIVHDAFVAVLERQSDIEKPGAYLRKVVVNNCYGATRRLSLGRRKADRLRVLEQSRAPQLAPELDEMWRSLELVTQRQRTALVLRYYVDLPVAEIAELMDVRPGTVKSLLHRGISTLRTELSNEQGALK